MKREFKFDLDIILRNCERFGVKIERGEGISGVTMNGEPFDVTTTMSNAFNELSLNSYPLVSSTVTSNDVEIYGAAQNQKERSIRVSLGESRITIPEQFSFSKENASLNAA